MNRITVKTNSRSSIAALCNVSRIGTKIAVIGAVTLTGLAPCAAQDGLVDTPSHSDRNSKQFEARFQATFIDQQLFRFRSPYRSINSFLSRGENEISKTATLFLGARVARGLELYVNPELARGNGLGGESGVGGYVNGDFLHSPLSDKGPYFARYFLRWTVALGHATEKLGAAENQFVGSRPIRRLTMTAGKLSAPDIFDTNAYANSARTQFINWTFVNNGAYDYPADETGYSKGLAIEYFDKTFAFRIGSFEMPLVPGGRTLAANFSHSRTDQFEIEARPRLLSHGAPMVIRALAYRGFANRGRFADALKQAVAGSAPDVTAVRRAGAGKDGFGLNFEQPLSDDGNTGVFGRLGWNDGRSETYCFAEIDRTVAFGAQISGRNWGKPDDRIGIAIAQNDLSAEHRNYLAAGGVGLQLGDGRLNYASERILETYYSYQLTRTTALSLDCQVINHPGYNSDRGPVSVVSLRLHLER